ERGRPSRRNRKSSVSSRDTIGGQLCATPRPTVAEDSRRPDPGGHRRQAAPVTRGYVRGVAECFGSLVLLEGSTPPVLRCSPAGGGGREPRPSQVSTFGDPAGSRQEGGTA